ncbi:transposase [Patescibacteria group bacterium]|nr:transposase [Patescibacteria group bacterium]
MSKKYHARSLMDFLGELSTEAVCEQYLMQMRWPDGMPCPDFCQLCFVKNTMA